MAKILNKEPAVYKKEQDNFLRELRKFHDSKGTSFKLAPSINGKEIDLYLLYWLVTAQGGWERVNSKNAWDELLVSFDLPTSTCNGSLAIKQTYLRYLDAYEKYYFLGEEEEDESNPYFDEEDGRARRERQRKIVQNVPTSYNEAQHRISENLRANYGLSTDLYQKTDYDRLGLSLLSPLPNEQDFAINVCTLLSNEGRHTLKLGKCPRLLDILLAHAGVFNHHSLRDYVSDNYLTVRSYDQIKFWRDVCKEKNVLQLIYDERNFYPDKADNLKDRSLPSDSQRDEVEELSGRERIAAVKARASAELEEEEDDELFCSGRQNGTKELTGQRVLQVATILRNLSFEDDNSPVLAKNLTALRFVLLCVNSSWANLNQMGFDILSNIACNVQLEEPSEDAVTDLLLSTLSRCIGAQDRFQVISSLDVLSKLCGQENNEDFIQRLLDGKVYSRLVEYLSLHDIHLLITVLECLYSLTSLGELPCTALARTHSALELLVSLVTVEAQSYGPKACILMRVVETVPGTTAVSAATSQPAPTTLVTGTPLAKVSPALPTQPLPQPAVTNILPRHPVPLTRPPGQVVRPAPPPGSQQVQLRVSNDEPHRAFCLSWLKATYEPQGGKSIEQNIMYKQYLASMHRMGRKEVISAQHYALCIRTLFGGSTGPNKKQVGDKIENHYTGIQVRESPLPLKLTPAQAAAAQEASKQQTSPSPPAQNGVSQAAVIQPATAVVQQQQQQQQPQQQQVIQTSGKIVTTGGQQIIVNAQGQLIQGGLSGGKVLVNTGGGQQIIVNSSNQQVIQVNPANIVSSGGQLIVNQAGQVVQQRIVNSQGQIVAQGMVHGQVISSGMQNRTAVLTQQPQQQQQSQTQHQPQPQVQAQVQPQIQPQIQPQQIQLQPQQHQPQVQVQVQQQQPGQQQPQMGQVLQRIIHPGGRVEERLVQASPVPGQPGQMVIHTASGQQIVQTQPASTVVSSANTQGQIMRNTTPVTAVQLNNQAPRQQQQQQQLQPQLQPQPVNEDIIENGISPLDGILPKDFGGDMLSDLLDKKVENNLMVNGVVNHLDTSKMNGELTGGKRLLLDQLDSPAKKQAVESGGVAVVTNGGHGNGVNGGAVRAAVPAPQAGQYVQNASGQIFLKTSSSSGGVVLQPAGQAGSGVVLQPAGQTGGGMVLQPSGQTGSGHVIVQNSEGQKQLVFLQQTDGQKAVMRPAQTVVRVAPQDNLNKLPQVDGAVDDVEEEVEEDDPGTNTNTDQQEEPAEAALDSPSASGDTAASPAPSPSPPPAQVKIDTQKPFMCEWAGCMKAFKTPKEVENHAIALHCPLGSDDIPCLWARCDGMKRKRFSLMTHLQDRHCHPQLMKLMAVRRVQIAQTGKSDVPLPPAPPPHPGYAPNAALHAIKRHAVEFANPKELAMRDEKEGPVTKSIRLTASLILKNLVIYSSLGRSRLRAYESHLSTVALSNVESSRTVSQILFEMANATEIV